MAKKNSAKKSDQVVAYLSRFLADTFILYTKTLNFHWNMVGPQFFMYHKLLEHQYKELADALDELAERIRMLGAESPGSLQEFLSLASQKEPKGTLNWMAMVRELTVSHETMVAHCHKIIEFTDQVGDQGTSDLMIDRLRAHDKNAWLLRSHLEK